VANGPAVNKNYNLIVEISLYNLKLKKTNIGKLSQ
jgi:hypothetical protein